MIITGNTCTELLQLPLRAFSILLLITPLDALYPDLPGRFSSTAEYNTVVRTDGDDLIRRYRA